MTGVPREDATEQVDGMTLPLARETQQFTVKYDDSGNVGDCLRACICSLFNIEVEHVPHFARYGFDDPKEVADHHGWWWALVGFVDTLEPSYATLTLKPEEAPEPSESVDDLFGCYMASGKSPRGDWQHCVVGRGGEIIWDPHPSRAGLDGPVTEITYFKRRDVVFGRTRDGEQ